MADTRGWSWREISGSDVFRSKLRAPSAQRLLRRAVLIDQLDACAVMPLSLIIGPAGTGKTSLAATWVASTHMPTAWLSLDDGDHDATHFWTGVIAALEDLTHDDLGRALTLLQRPGSIDDAVRALLNELEASEGPPSTLVIDDIHVIDDNDQAVASFAVFVQHLPRWLHVILLARRPPQLPLVRMRARGELGEIGFADLMLRNDEAAALLRALTPSLDENTQRAVVSRADGWAAGIQLAALAARSRRPRTSPPPDELENLLVSDYVWQEVFAAERPELIDALLDIAVADRVNPELATCLCGVADARRLLSEAEARGLFVHRLDSGDWYEIHTLVRERLRDELLRRSPSRAADMHVRAARWFEEAGEVALALDHWILAQEHREALRLLAAKVTALYDSGREATIVRTIARLPATIARGDLEAAIELAWSNLLVGNRIFLPAVERVSTWARQITELSPMVRGRLTMLQSFAATMKGDWSQGGDLARRALSEQGYDWSSDPLGRFSWNMVARDIALSENWEATAQVRTAQREVSCEPERRLAFEGTRALAESLTGHPVDALRIAAGVREAATVANMTILRLELAAAEAIAHRELADRSLAQSELIALAASSPGPVGYACLLADLELAQSHLDDGDIEGAESAFSRAEELVESNLDGPGARSWLGRVGTLVALAKGDVDHARRWSVTIDDPFWRPISRARVQLVLDNNARALHCCDEAIARSARQEVILGLIRARASKHHTEALEAASAAAELASVSSLVQTVASEGTQCLKLIELNAWRLPGVWLDRVRRASWGFGAARSKSLRLGETLTDREREVLRLLHSRLTLREIADELFISMNTLKFHLKVIYRKLGCNSRAEAVAAGQVTIQPAHRGQASEMMRR